MRGQARPRCSVIHFFTAAAPQCAVVVEGRGNAGFFPLFAPPFRSLILSATAGCSLLTVCFFYISCPLPLSVAVTHILFTSFSLSLASLLLIYVQYVGFVKTSDLGFVKTSALPDVMQNFETWHFVGFVRRFAKRRIL